MPPQQIDFGAELAAIDFDKELADLTPVASHGPTPVTPVNVGGRGTGLDVRQSKENFGELAPYLGGLVGSLTGGIPGAVAGGTAGQAIKAASQDRVPGIGELAWAGGTNAAAEVANPLVAKGVTKVGTYVGSKAMPLVRSAIKPTVTAMKQQAGASMTGLEAQAKRVAGILLKNKWTKSDQAVDAIQGAERELTDVLANSDATLDTAERVPRYLGKLERSSSRQIMPGSDPGTVRAASQAVLKGPLGEDVVAETLGPSASGLVDEFGKPMLVPTHETTRAMRTDVKAPEGLELARGTGRWGNRKAWGELKGAEQEASKTAERAVRDSVKEAVPEAKPILQKQGDALKALPVLDRMAFREGNRDAISLPAWAMASGGGLGARTLGAALANYIRNNQLSMGMRAAQLGPAMTRSAAPLGRLTAEELRVALIAALSADTPTQ